MFPSAQYTPLMMYNKLLSEPFLVRMREAIANNDADVVVALDNLIENVMGYSPSSSDGN